MRGRTVRPRAIADCAAMNPKPKKSTAPRKADQRIDPAILLNDGPWEEFDALCREEHARLKKESSQRWMQLALIAVPSITALLCGVLWFAGLSYVNSFIIVYLCLLAIVGLFLSQKAGSFRMQLHQVLAIAAMSMVFAALIVLVAVWTQWLERILDNAFIYAIFGGGYGLYWFWNHHVSYGSHHSSLVSRTAKCFGWTYDFLARKFPSGKTGYLGDVHQAFQIRDHVAGEWRGLKFHAGRYQEEEDDRYLLLQIDSIGIDPAAAEATTHAEFPDAPQNPESIVENLDDYTLRVQADTQGQSARQFLVNLMPPLKRIAEGRDIYVAVASNKLMIFMRKPEGLFPFDEVQFQVDPDGFFAGFEANFALILRIADTVASVRKSVLYPGAA